MPFRGSLCRCVESAIGRLRRVECDFVVITANHNGKYYTLYHPSEYEARLINKPLSKDHLVLRCTGGELATMIGTAQMNLNLEEKTDDATIHMDIGQQPGTHSSS